MLPRPKRPATFMFQVLFPKPAKTFHTTRGSMWERSWLLGMNVIQSWEASSASSAGTDLLFAFVFCSCSSCLAYHSSSSFIAFSFHSASCFRELASLKGRRRNTNEAKHKLKFAPSISFSLTKLTGCAGLCPCARVCVWQSQEGRQTSVFPVCTYRLWSQWFCLSCFTFSLSPLTS